MFKHLDLFSGIGCWALASREVWPEREMAGFCEIEKFPQEILKKHYPDVPIYEDIKELHWPPADSTGDRRVWGGQTAQAQEGLQQRPEPAGELERGLKRPHSPNEHDIDLLTASPPCQAASSAGKRKGTDDSRWLWPETVRVIGEVRPRWLVLENVYGLLSLEGGLAFDKVCADVEAQGYEVWPFVLPAAGVEAPHQRYRVWIVGRRVDEPEAGEDTGGLGRSGRGESWSEILGGRESEVQAQGPGGESASYPTLGNDRGNAGELSEKNELQTTERQEEWATESGCSGGESDTDRSDFIEERQQSVGERAWQPQEASGVRGGDAGLAPRSEWNRDWRTVAYETCWENEVKPGVHRVDDRTPDGLHVAGKPISKAKHRTERIKACGNAIVGQVAVEIMRAIKEADHAN